jgi:ribosomal protein S18 acetylase RimI-like enzyme
MSSAVISPVPPLRLATELDASAIAVVHVEGWRWGYRGVLPSELLDGLSVASREDMWRSVLARQSTTEGRVWVAARADQLVGFVATGLAREATPAPEGERVAELFALYQVEATAGTGLGRRLVAHALDDLRSRGFDAVVLWVIDRNTRARGFYERMGFRADGAMKDDDDDGVVLRELRYRLALDATPGNQQ